MNESEPKKNTSPPLTLPATLVWAITTAVIGWAGQRLYDTYLKTERADASQQVETKARDRDYENVRREQDQLARQLVQIENRLLSIETSMRGKK